MPGTFDLDYYRCTAGALPLKLWRVIHPGSQSLKHPYTGDLLAANWTRRIDHKDNLEEALEHFDWYSKEDSCFLSVFSDIGHTLSWAEQRAEDNSNEWNDGRDEVYINEIDTAKLPADTYVFDAQFLKIELGIEYEFWEDELIFLHRIPGKSIASTQSLPSVRPQKLVNRRPIYVVRAGVTPDSIASQEFITQVRRQLGIDPR